MGIMNMEMDQIAAFICQTSIDLAIRVCVVLLGVFDFAYQWWEYEKALE